MALANLPGRSERSAPKFDDSQPEELERYFADLEGLFDLHGVNVGQERKQGALKYLKVQTENLWKTAESWTDNTKTYDEFKDEIFKLYPSAKSDRTYSIQDLDLVIGHYARTGILNSVELGEYHRRFLLISRYLISKNRLATQEQSRSFFRGLGAQLEGKVRLRLELKLIDHYPDDPYTLADVYEAAHYVLMGNSSTMLAPTQGSSPASLSATASPSPQVADATQVKLESLTTAISSLSETVKSLLQTQQAGPSRPRPTGVASAGTNASGNSVCNFCGVPGHFIRECEIVEEFTRFGKCKRSPEGKVVLPTGAQVPRSVPGAWMRDRVEEWHRQNPGQMAAQMYVEVTAAPAATAPPKTTAGQSYYSYPAPNVDQSSGGLPAGVYALKRPLPPRPEVVITTLPPHRRGHAGAGNNAGGGSSSAAPQRQQTEVPPPESQEASGANKGKTLEHNLEPEHPYAAARDATHGVVPGPGRPVIREQAPGRHEPGFHNTARIFDPLVARTIYERAMETPITVTQRELLSLAPEVRSQVADATIKRRVPREAVAQTLVEEASEATEEQARLVPVPHATIEEIPDDDSPAPVATSSEATRLAHMPAAFSAAVRTPPPNATIIPDPYETYLQENGSNTNAESTIAVAAESRALRAIMPTVDGQDRVEAILDPGCQVVAMSEEVCNALALHYDPSIRLHMMSANGGVDQSLGLARNVPFLVGDITLYLQVHILRKPAYDILLGRPFDVLTQSIVRNYADENQTVTIIDPNTSRKATVPTIPRGSFRFADRRTKRVDF